MKIAILHCHFERGGVTQVVENHVRFLRSCPAVDQIALLSGPRSGGLSPSIRQEVSLLQVDDFDYDTESYAAEATRERATEIAQRVTESLREAGMSPETTILHWHNHSLGKNTAAPQVIRLLAAAGWRLLLQIHDFAEDGRPSNYAQLVYASGADDKQQIDAFLYPQANQIHYATLTEFDAAVMQRVGVPSDRLHCLPNSVTLPENASEPNENPQHNAERSEAALAKVRKAMNLPADARWCLYPVRGIRRKNVGEFLLLSRWMPENIYSALTLRPTTRIEHQSYARWEKLASEVSPRSIFDAAHHPDVSFADNLAACQFVLSTSVAEGFGMAYLEPWLASRAVIARELPAVTDDFNKAGVEFPLLYRQVVIPAEQLWREECLAATQQAEEAAWSEVPIELRPQQITSNEQLQTSSLENDTLDFARLTPLHQIEVLRRAAFDSGFEKEMRVANQILINAFDEPGNAHQIDANASAIDEHFSLQRTGARLLEIYERIAAVDVDSETGDLSGEASAVDLIHESRPFFPCRLEDPIVEG